MRPISKFKYCRWARISLLGIRCGSLWDSWGKTHPTPTSALRWGMAPYPPLLPSLGQALLQTSATITARLGMTPVICCCWQAWHWHTSRDLLPILDLMWFLGSSTEQLLGDATAITGPGVAPELNLHGHSCRSQTGSCTPLQPGLEQLPQGLEQLLKKDTGGRVHCVLWCRKCYFIFRGN